MKKSEPPKPVVITLDPKEVVQPIRFAMQSSVAKSDDVLKHELLSGNHVVDKITFVNRAIIQYWVDRAEDLGPQRGRIKINPPPEDGRCECCGRHISELEPFGKAGDPLVGNFEGALLVKNFRGVVPYDQKAILAVKGAEMLYPADSKTDLDDWVYDWLKNKYGEEEGMRIFSNGAFWDQMRPSWECRDCMVLNENEYFERMGMK